MTGVFGRRWISLDAQLLMAQTGARNPIAAMVQVAEEVIDIAGFERPPLTPQIAASIQGVHDVRLVEMAQAGRLRPDGERLIIEVNRNHSTGKRNFTIDHEVSHTLLPTYAGAMVEDMETGSFSSSSEEERLCDIGAAALLLDRRYLLPSAIEAGPSLNTLFWLAELFGASLQSTAWRLADLDIWPCAFVFWEDGFRKADRPNAQQPLMPVFEAFGRPAPKLRVSHVYPSTEFGLYIPINKSVDDDSLVARCCGDVEFTWGVEKFDLGHTSVSLYSENRYVPYRSGPEMKRRVVTMLTRSALTQSSGSLVQYRMESF